jgi:hypothetical protein
MVENLSLQLMVMAASAPVGMLITALLIRPACWMYNRVNGLAPPGLGHSRSRNYTLVTSPDLRFYAPPKALSRYDRARTASGGVPLPGVLRCLGIAITYALGSSLIGALMYFVFSAAGNATGATQGMSLLLTLLVTLPVNLLIMAGLATLMLPTTFSRGLLVSLVYFLMLLVMGLVFSSLGGLAYGLLLLQA